VKVKRTKVIAAQRTKIGTLAAMSLGYGVVQLDVTIVNTAINSIGSTIGGGVAALQWIVNTYTIAFAAIILTAGALGDRIGAKRVFVVGFAIFTLASLACALAPSSAMLIVARAVQGSGAAILVPNSLALLNHAFSEEKQRGRAVAIWAAGASLALTAGPLAGGILSGTVGWRSIFLVNLPIGLAGLWLTCHYTTDTPRAPNREIDLPGQVTSILALGLLAGAIIEAGQFGWTNAWVRSGLAAAAVFIVLFVLRERRAKQPMLPLELFGHRAFTLSTAIGLMVNIAFYGLIFVLSLYFQRIDQFSPLVTGLAFIPMMAVVLPANLMAPRVSERAGAPLTIALGAGIAAVGALALLGMGRETRFWAMCPQLLALGGGLGLLVPPLTSVLLGSVNKAHSGIASGVLNSARQTGSVIGVALFGSLVAKSGAFIAGAHLSLIISAGLLLVSGVIMLGAQSINILRGSGLKV
jgi:MFS transporter, DHA2 family, methylenomycin A resistance protein